MHVNGLLSGFASDLDTAQRILLQNFNTPTETVFFQEPRFFSGWLRHSQKEKNRLQMNHAAEGPLSSITDENVHRIPDLVYNSDYGHYLKQPACSREVGEPSRDARSSERARQRVNLHGRVSGGRGEQADVQNACLQHLNVNAMLITKTMNWSGENPHWMRELHTQNPEKISTSFVDI
ncbi:hypothetical protein NQ318_004738 [Aromia moschata]|uniref:Uncharacterized protein n=1 Tax=Aromia moschata TaxID=1265417 RepID=A0AAV8XBH9_9CUCU|nr:hypothetical protein NQ318_004738 [Aromia moschata]